MVEPTLWDTYAAADAATDDGCRHGEPRGPRYCALCRRAGVQAGEAGRDAAVARVERNADAPWKRAAMAAIYKVAGERSRFTADDVWDAMPDDAGTHEPRAMGAMMLQAAKAGVIAATEDYTQSHRSVRHAGPMRVWESRVVGP